MCTGHRHPIFCILPPNVLVRIAQNGTPEQRDIALQSLGIDNTMRVARITNALMAVNVPRPAASAGPIRKERTIYDTKQSQELPGTVVRAEGQPATGDVSADRAYDGLGDTFDFYCDIYDRNSIDNAGLPLKATVHFGRKYDNAFWNGEQMVFGDGDGVIFNDFTISLDVIGHELTHGVTGSEANLTYQGQSGALNESISDVFGSLVKQYKMKQTADKADWLIGEGLLAPGIHGVALRSMKAPGTAFDDPVLGKDDQPAHMSDYVHASSDNGGVHTNSGIPNYAFYLVATALGGFAWQAAGQIWYDTLLDPRLRPSSNFATFANLTSLNASRRYGSTSVERKAVLDAWKQVGVKIRGSAAVAEAGGSV